MFATSPSCSFQSFLSLRSLPRCCPTSFLLASLSSGHFVVLCLAISPLVSCSVVLRLDSSFLLCGACCRPYCCSAGPCRCRASCSMRCLCYQRCSLPFLLLRSSNLFLLSRSPIHAVLATPVLISRGVCRFWLRLVLPRRLRPNAIIFPT